MTKRAHLNRQARRVKLVAQHAEKRAELVKVLKNPNASLDEKSAAYRSIQKLPRDSSHVRLHSRCAITGRPRSFYRRFGISRIMLRKLAHLGELPGVRKASW
jgi:small subunit ribosomal protein S14